MNNHKQYDFTKASDYNEEICRANIRRRPLDFENVIVAPKAYEEKVVIPPTDFL